MKSNMQNRQTDSALAKKIALSCQILAKLGQFKETTGHVSARSANGAAMWIRGRGKEESGLYSPSPAMWCWRTSTVTSLTRKAF